MEGAASIRTAEGMERSKRNFEKAAESLAVLVREVHGLSVPEETVRKWKTLLSAMRIVDDRIDHTADANERNVLVGKIKSSLNGEIVDFPNDAELAHAMLNVGILSADMGEERKEFFHTLLSLILKVTEEIKNEHDTKTAVHLTMLEGQVTGKLFLPFLPEEFKRSDRYQKLVHVLSRFGRTANAFDTFVDLPSDYEHKGSPIEPTVFNRVLFLGAALSSAASTINATGLSKDLLKEFIWSVDATMDNGSEK